MFSEPEDTLMVIFSRMANADEADILILIYQRITEDPVSIRSCKSERVFGKTEDSLKIQRLPRVRKRVQQLELRARLLTEEMPTI